MAPILDRKPSPPDIRDWRLRDFLEPASGHMTSHTPPADISYADKTVRELAAEGVSWSFWVSLWVLVKSLFTHPTPTPTPVPVPVPPTPTPGSQEAVIWQMTEDALDQGDSGHCCGFGGADWEDTLPVDDNVDSAYGHALYYLIKSIELGYPVPNYSPPGSGPSDVEDGAYVRDTMKALQKKGRLSNYAAANTVAEVVAWVRSKGPVIVGTNWYTGMDNYNTDTGLMFASGSNRGGHCWLVCGHVPALVKTPEGHVFTQPVIRMRNSWGNGWGVSKGYAYLSENDLAKLLAENGESWAAVELPVKP